jgi:uncharacterized membrane protein YidH (DUF202 family)
MNNEEENNNQNSNKIDTVITVVTVIGAFLVGRFLGLLGIGALAIGWFVFDRTKEKLGRFFAVCAGAVAGLAAYGLALIALVS